MRNSIAISLLLLAAPAVHGQETSIEIVGVEGKKLTDVTPGPISFSTGGPVGPAHGCAEPKCGATPEDPSGGAAITQAQKDQENKKNQEKAKSDNRVKDTIQATKDLITDVKSWLSKKIDASFSLLFWDRTYYPNNGGVKTDKGLCLSAKGGMGGTPNPNYKDPCVEVNAVPELVQRKDGVLEVQARIEYTVYNECFYENTCRPTYYSFIAGSEAELDRLLNGVLQ